MFNALNHTTSPFIQLTDNWEKVFTTSKWSIFAVLLLQMFLPVLTTMHAQTITWGVQSDYFGERNAVAQTRTIRSMAVSKDGSAVYTGNIQSPNVGSNAIRKVSSATLAVSGTDHVIFGNGMPGGTGAFGPVGGQPVYAGGATGTFLAWTATGNSPRGLATDDRGYVYAALSSGISPANQVVIFSNDLSTIIGTIAITGPTGVSVRKSGSTYYLYIAADTQLKRYDVTNAALPTLDAGWTNTITSGAMGLTVDTDGTVFLAGGGQVRRISAAGAVTHTATLAGAADIALFLDKIYVIRQVSPAQPIVVYNKADLSSGGADLVVPELGVFTRGSLSQFTAIDVTSDGRLWVSEENYTAGSNGIPSYTPPATSFNPTPGAITGRIYFDRVLVSSPVADPCDVVISDVTTTPENCPGANDGGITITASTSAGPLTYNISGPVNISQNNGIFSNLPDGAYTITVSDDGVAGCEATTTVMVSAGVDMTLPTINCSNQTIVFSGEPSIALNAANLATAGDNCGVDHISLSPSVINCAQIGTTVPVTITVTDVNGNMNSCVSQVTVSGQPCGWIGDPDGVNCEDGSSVAYNPATQVFTVTSANCYYANPFTSDELAFAQYSLCGNGSITAQVTSINGSALGWAGVVMREDNTGGAKKAQLMTNLSNTVSRREFRTTTGGQAYPQQFPTQNRYWLRLVRSGNQFSMSVSPNGQAWSFIGAQNIAMNSCIQIGLVVSNYSPNSTVAATFANVSTTGAVAPLVAPDITTTTTAASSFEVYPNPATSEVNVNLSIYANRMVRLEVYDIQGKVLKVIEVDAAETITERLDLSTYQNGIYLIRAKSEGLPDATQRVVLHGSK